MHGSEGARHTADNDKKTQRTGELIRLEETKKKEKIIKYYVHFLISFWIRKRKENNYKGTVGKI